jgi:hypothetical protein
MYGATPRSLPQFLRLTIGVPPKLIVGSAKLVPSVAYPVWVIVCSHRFGEVSLPAGVILSPDDGKVWARSHLSTVR